MREVDFHGFTIEEALIKVDKIIDEVRMRGEAEDYRFITGTGDLQVAILEKLRDEYQLECGLQYCNQGVILAYIE